MILVDVFIGEIWMCVIMSYGSYCCLCVDNFEGEVEDYILILNICEEIFGCFSYCFVEVGIIIYEWI